jgi:hypothetical protein
VTFHVSIEFEPFKILDHLINDWCERRALRPLRYLLDAYPGVLAHTEQQLELVEALKKVKALCRDDLTKEEYGWLLEHMIFSTNDFEHVSSDQGRGRHTLPGL